MTTRPQKLFCGFALLLFGCEDSSFDRDEREPEVLEIYPQHVDAYQTDRTLAFAVGLRSELRVTGTFGMAHGITAARCVDGSCSVERATDPRATTTARSSRFFVTPRAPTFRIHIELIADAGPPVLDKELTAVDGAMGALHRGAGPGVPFVAGTSITWLIAPQNKRVAWDPQLSTISVTPPFALVSEPQVGGGPDNQTFVDAHIRATAAGTGTLTHMNGDATATFPLVAIGRDEIRKLHVAPVPEEPRMVDSQPLSRIATDRISIGSSDHQRVWVVFETASGAFGIAGAGESLPSPGAVFDIEPFTKAYYSFGLSSSGSGSGSDELPPEDQPFLTLRGVKAGSAKLLLWVGDVTGSADVVVGGTAR